MRDIFPGWVYHASEVGPNSINPPIINVQTANDAKNETIALPDNLLYFSNYSTAPFMNLQYILLSMVLQYSAWHAVIYPAIANAKFLVIIVIFCHILYVEAL